MLRAHRIRILPALAMLLPSLALASDFRGFYSGMVIFGLGSMAALANLVLFAILGLCRAYRYASVALVHAAFASVVPMIGFVMMMIEGSSVPEDGIRDRLIFNALALAIAFLPVLVHLVIRRADYRSVPPETLFRATRIAVEPVDGIPTVAFADGAEDPRNYLVLQKLADGQAPRVELNDRSRSCDGGVRTFEVRADQIIVTFDRRAMAALGLGSPIRITYSTSPRELKALRAAIQQVH